MTEPKPAKSKTWVWVVAGLLVLAWFAFDAAFWGAIFIGAYALTRKGTGAAGPVAGGLVSDPLTDAANPAFMAIHADPAHHGTPIHHDHGMGGGAADSGLSGGGFSDSGNNAS